MELNLIGNCLTVSIDNFVLYLTTITIIWICYSVLVLYSKLAAWRQRVKNATFSRQDLFKVDYTKYNNIVIFGVEEMVIIIGSLSVL